MRSVLLLLIITLCSQALLAQSGKVDPAKPLQAVEASCGQCKFGMKEKKGCDLAVRIDGKSYFVDGTGLDDHGDAHAEDGFCEAIRKAEVQGEVVDNRFKATYFKLLPQDKEKIKTDKKKG